MKCWVTKRRQQNKLAIYLYTTSAVRLDQALSFLHDIGKKHLASLSKHSFFNFASDSVFT